MALTADDYAEHEPRHVSPFTYTEAAASAAARAFFYPSLLWNLARSRLQADWHWWDQITPTVLLGALPFESMLAELSSQGVKAVVTLNEDFEVFISSDKYKELGFNHLHLPTVDFLFAPVLSDLHRGVDFIEGHCERGQQVYVHCKAGRGRSTTLVMCYLIRCCGMTPENALTHIQLRRPQVCLAPGQWAAILDFDASCQPGKLQAAAAEPRPALAAAGLHSSHQQPPSQVEDSASDLLEPHRKGSPAFLEDSATLQHEQHDADVDATYPPSDAPDITSSFDMTSAAPSPADQPFDGRCSSSPELDPCLCSSALCTSPGSNPLSKPARELALSLSNDPAAHSQRSLEPPQNCRLAAAADELQRMPHPLVGAATITGGMACSEEATVPLADLQPLASVSSETWEAVSFPSSMPFGLGQPSTNSEVRCQDAAGFAPALRVLGWPSSLAGPPQGAHVSANSGDAGSTLQSPAAVAAAASPAFASSAGRHAQVGSRPQAADVQPPCSSGDLRKNGKQSVQAPILQPDAGQNRASAAEPGIRSQQPQEAHQRKQQTDHVSCQLCQPAHDTSQQSAAGSAVHQHSNSAVASSPFSFSAAPGAEHLRAADSDLHQYSKPAQSEATCESRAGGAPPTKADGSRSLDQKAEGAPSAEANTTTLAMNTLQATGYQQIDDWATLQPDGSMHDLPASSLWSW